MKIEYNSKFIERVCTDTSYSIKKYGLKTAKKLMQRLDQISASETVEQLISLGYGRCHPLKGDRDGQYAINLLQPYRLIFSIRDNVVQIANIIEIVDYH